MPLEYVKSQRGNALLKLRGHLFMREKRGADGRTIWKCTHYRKTKCLGRVHTMDDEVLNYDHEAHNHAADCGKVLVREVVETIRDRAAVTNEQRSTHQIIADATTGLSTAVSAQMPNVSSLKRMIHRVRQHETYPTSPEIPFDSAHVPSEYKLTYGGIQFLLYHGAIAGDRPGIIFGTGPNLDLLAQSDAWYISGSFENVPAPFARLYTIHAKRTDAVIPLIYAALPNDSVETYSHVLELLCNMGNQLRPSTIFTDYEQNNISACQKIFPNATLQGCFFHLGQRVYRRVQGKGLRNQYESDADFALIVRMIPALAFVPVDHVVETFELLIDEIDDTSQMQIISDYFEDNWIGRPTHRNERRSPKFALQYWNCYSSVINGEMSTSHYIELWNRRFSQKLEACRSSVWNFFEVMKQEQKLNETKISKLIMGQSDNAVNKKHDLTTRIFSIVSAYDVYDNAMEYLRDLACTFGF